MIHKKCVSCKSINRNGSPGNFVLCGCVHVHVCDSYGIRLELCYAAVLGLGDILLTLQGHEYKVPSG